MQKVIVVRSMNITPTDQLEVELQPLLEEGFRVTSATTSLVTMGEMNTDGMLGEGRYHGVARHVYYATTVILEK